MAASEGELGMMLERRMNTGRKQHESMRDVDDDAHTEKEKG